MKRLLLAILVIGLSATLAACGGGGGGGGVGGGSTPTGSVPVDTATPANLTAAAASFNGNDLDQAISGFNEVLLDAAANASAKAKATEGLGFAYLRSGRLDQAISTLDASRQASGDSGVALSTAYLAKSGVNALDTAVTVLAAAVGGGLSWNAGAITTGVTESQGRALHALLLTLRGAPADLAAAATEEQAAIATGAADPATAKLLQALDLLQAE